MRAGEAVILLGSNIDPAVNIRKGALGLGRHLTVLQASSVWLTPAIGTTGPDFYNAAVRVACHLSPDDLKFTVLRPLEQELGRLRTSDKYAPRTLDLDTIIHNAIVLETRLWTTAFILLPVAELVSDLIHPISGRQIHDMANEIEPTSGASRLSDFPLFA